MKSTLLKMSRLGILFLSFLIIFSSCKKEDEATPAAPEPEAPTKNILDTVVDNTKAATPQFTKLAAAATAADLLGPLQGTDKLTVFAPTDAAFEALGETLTELLKPENKVLLGDILKYHIVSGEVKAADLSVGEVQPLYANAKITVSKDGDAFKIDGAGLVSTDVLTTNGVIHVIDKVIVPSDLTDKVVALTAPKQEEPTQNILEVVLAKNAEANPEFTKLAAAATAAGLLEPLKGADKLTVFAPTDAAFDALGDKLPALLEPVNKDLLAKILKFHIVSGSVKSSDLAVGEVQPLYEGAKISVSKEGDVFKINGAGLVATDVETTNGVIHIIDAVILPSDLSEEITALKPSDDILTTVVNSASADQPQFTKLKAAVEAAELTGPLMGDDVLTVFAPTDAAFDAVDQDTLTELLKPANKELLGKILQYHIVAGKVLSTDLAVGNVDALYTGSKIMVTKEGEAFKISGAGIVTADLKASNGIIHVIDKVLIPADLANEVGALTAK